MKTSGLSRADRDSALLVCATLVLVVSSPARADIDIDLRPLSQSVMVNDPVNIGMYAVSDSASSQFFSSMDVIISWDPSLVQLTCPIAADCP